MTDDPADHPSQELEAIAAGETVAAPAELPTDTERSTASSEGSSRRRWIILGVVLLAQLMLVLDGTVVNVALPNIQRDLHLTEARLTWVNNSYLVAFGGFLLLFGRLGDLIGRQKMFLMGIALFSGASLACGLVESDTGLVIARFVQAWARRRPLPW